MSKRAFNFNAGPAALPLEVLERAQAEFVDYRNTGMSIMEMSHRGAVYEAVHNEAQERLLSLLGNPSGYKVLFIQGGASTQFAMIPMNFLGQGQAANYVMTGSWADKALKEAKLIGETHVAASSEESKYMSLPKLADIQLSDNAAYLHLTSNETIEGTQFKDFPDTGAVPLICDMSSDILSRPFDLRRFGMVYAGAQKNLGPSGVAVVIVREDLITDSPKHLPTMLRYNTYLKNNSLYNTPPSFGIYMINEVLKWIEEKGGLAGVQDMNRKKAALIYDAIDNSGGFYRGCVNPDSRSDMNITFRLETEELEKEFVKASEKEGFVGLKGHRSVGGLRASVYNAVPYESCKALVDFMEHFKNNR
ncbi:MULTISPECIES: 3-phosphoserine/phosphohydroxythreonine transaminase [Paenibacillus]|uniref:3-phosphoserine/phosphohydroxythreonine transaminase n=1 Tax=Paenibacillus TaxID=44249 RepID=UPI001B0F620E|nr:3-phosphoserine/phosphohydroxythreonine transaminase [Paenibacillus lactis]MCM3492998.1 3-phosphoserine/phosphohydroxythreonine transaminase [Paenibacillus lactis]GIO89702.1 phosphoserine aminotransferase [Paenibacillus lactis]